MSHLNVEIKARTSNPSYVREYLVTHSAFFKGTDHQTDTYFNTFHGRLKLREGNIENNLIYYERSNQAGPKDSFFKLVKVEDAKGLKESLAKSNGVKTIVTKKREIYFIDNVKFHIDEVPGLGDFIEIEASNLNHPKTAKELRQQCEYYMQQFKIVETDLVENSYSDMQ